MPSYITQTTPEIAEAIMLQGYCTIGRALTVSALVQSKTELVQIEEYYMNTTNYFAHIINQETRFMIHKLQFESCPTVHKLIYAHPIIERIAEMTGDDLICTSCTYAHCKPGYLGIPLHTDYDPYASNPYRPSNPVALRVLFYLDDLTSEKAPLRLIPRSHLSLHKSRHHDVEIIEKVVDEIEITCPAGTAIIINTKLFHGVGPNKTNDGRRVLAITLRPRWAGPLHSIAEYSDAQLTSLSDELRPFFTRLNLSKTRRVYT